MPERLIDLRSDTVTKPTPAMRRAMANADVGDDVLGDDPTVSRLEARVAEILGKQAALYMPSGTMTNQVALRTHTEAGDEILLHEQSHVYFYEGGAPAALSGCLLRLLGGERGQFTPETLAAALHPPGEINPHYCTQKLVVLENTHNRGGGSIWPMEHLQAVQRVARGAGLRMHLDGARLWNAAVATGIAESRWAEPFDTVSVCFSKGLGAPVGSALAGSSELMARARRFRKQFGGGMRQAGIIAAGALHALEHHRDRLADDHHHARRLAEGLAEIPGLAIDLARVETNILYVHTAGPAADFCARAQAVGVLILPTAERTFRAVTHLDVSADDIEHALSHLASLATGP